MSIIERTTKLLLTQFKGSSINPAFMEYYTSDMKKIDDAYTSVDNRLSALETASQDYAERLTSLESWKSTTDTIITEYDNRLDAIEAVIETVSTANIDALTLRVDALEDKAETNSQHIATLFGNYEAVSNAIQALQRVDTEHDARITVLENKVSTLEDCCSEVRTTLSQYGTRITQNENDIDTLNNRIIDDEALIRANAQDIAILATQVQTNAANINRILEDIPIDDILNAVTRIDALETLCGSETLVTTAQTLTGAVNELAGELDAISTLDTRLTSAEGDITALQTKVGSATLTTTAQDLSGAVNELDAELSTLGGLPAMVNSLSDRVAHAESNVNGLDIRVDALSDVITGLDTTISEISNDLDTVESKVSAIETLDGDGQLDTTADNFTGAINELNSAIGKVNGNLTTKGLLFTFQRQNGWCRCVISGTLTEAIADGIAWADGVPSDFIPSALCNSSAIAPANINNAGLTIEFDTSGVITGYSSVGTIAIGASINHQMVYPV